MKSQTNKLGVLRMIYSSPAYVVVNIAAAAFYYFLFRYLLASQNYGIFLLNVPNYLIYALVISSSVLLTLGAYGIKSAFESRSRAVGEQGASAATTIVGAVISGCASCQAPFVGSLLYAFGFNTLTVSSILSGIGGSQELILAAFIVINLALIYYSTAKIAEGCKIRPRRRKG
ncbi:MAG TPA: hypothetical protein VND15_03030 [Candidatus Acidoferrales bacterium]|nr:hypothetical protein [Candidatus Acidoferrales bacterium]